MKGDKVIENNITLEINEFVNKIDESIKNFRFNVSIAYFYQAYKILKDYKELKISNKVLGENLIKIMKLMLPLTPHLSNECLELFKCNSTNNWPIIDKENILNKISIAVQINGKTRDIISVKKDLDEKDVDQFILKNSKAKKYILSKKISKTIFVKNKIINYIITN